MAISNLDTIYVVEMFNVDNGEIITLNNAYVSLDAAYDYIDECKGVDDRTGTTGCWTYSVKAFTLYR